MNKIQRKRLKRRTDLKLLFFTFIGAFFLFFTAFTYFLPILTPEVKVPALSEDYVLDSITSQDFRGKIDPRLHSIELYEEAVNIKKANNIQTRQVPAVSAPKEPASITPGEEKTVLKVEKQETKQEAQKKQEEPQKVAVNIPPRPKPIELRERVKVAPPVPVYNAKVVVGDFSNPKEVKIASDILTSLSFEPFIRERNGKYILQVASFSEVGKAEALVNELKDRNFDAKIIYE